MKRRILTVLTSVFFVLLAAGVAAYPMISNYVNDKYQSVVRTQYAEELENTDSEALSEAWAAAKAYNDSLQPVRFNRDQVQAAGMEYETLLNIDGSGIMGYVEIPKLSINLPIYHGTSEESLEKGVGHLLGSSLPVGGRGSHCVLTGHSGVAGNKLFSDIDCLKTDDVFYLHVLNQTLAYAVTEINKVFPYETELLAPVSGEDYCTLVTCTPYGVNTHRLLVRGSRIPYEEAVETESNSEKTEEPVQSTWKQQYYRGLAIGGGCAIGAILLGLMGSWVRKKRRHGHAE